MTKAELIERIVDALIDPWTDDPNDYLNATPIDIEYAKVMLKDLRDNEDDADLEQDERLPEEVTPELVMIAYNCLIRARKNEARVNRLAEFITDYDMVCEYDNYYLPDHHDAVDITPIDFLDGTDRFPFDIGNNEASVLDMLLIGKNSANTFNPKDEYCWFDADAMTLHSTNEPFRDGLLDAKGFAEYIMSDEGQDCFEYITESIMTDEDFKYVFGCTREEMKNE